jgi:hypothetical protein
MLKVRADNLSYSAVAIENKAFLLKNVFKSYKTCNDY